MAGKNVKIVILGDASSVQQAFKQVDLAAGGTQEKLSKFGSIAKGALVAVGAAAAVATAKVAAAVVDMGKEGVQAFVEFQKGMNEVFTLLPGISAKAMGSMTQDVKDFAREFGVLPEKTIPALYQAISAGVPADNVFAFLKTAQKAAVAGVAELEVAVDGISSVINAYGSEVLSAAEASDLMFTAVKLGKTTFDELARSLYNVVPTAAAIGVKFGDVTAALATMTAQGVPTSVATTQLRQLFVELSKEGGKVAQTFQKLSGKSFSDFIKAGGDTNEALRLLQEYAEKAGIKVSDLFSSVEAGNAALALTGKSAEVFARNIREMGNAAGATDEAYARMEESLGRTIERIKANFDVLKVNIGEKLAPVVERFSEWLIDNMPTIERVVVGTFTFIGDVLKEVWRVIEGLIGAFKMIFTNDAGLQGFQAVFENFGQTGVTVVSRIRDAWNELVTFFSEIGAIVAPIFEELLNTIGPIISDFVQVFTGGWGEIKEQSAGIWQGVKDLIIGILEAIRDFIIPVLKDIQKFWADHGEAIMAAVKTAWDIIRTTISTAMGIIQALISVALSIIAGDWSGAWAGIQKAGEIAWEGIKVAMGAALGLLAGIARAALNELATAMSNSWAEIKAVADVWWDTIKMTIVGVVTGIPEAVAGGLSGLADAIAEPLRKAWNTTVEWVNKIRVALASIDPWLRKSPAPADEVVTGIGMMGQKMAQELELISRNTAAAALQIRSDIATMASGGYAIANADMTPAKTMLKAASVAPSGGGRVFNVGPIYITGARAEGEAAGDAILTRLAALGVTG